MNEVFVAMLEQILITNKTVLEDIFTLIPNTKLYECDVTTSIQKFQALANAVEKYSHNKRIATIHNFSKI